MKLNWSSIWCTKEKVSYNKKYNWTILLVKPDIFLACGILDNFLLEEDHDKELEDEVIHEVLNATPDEEIYPSRDKDDRGEELRNSIANECKVLDLYTKYAIHDLFSVVI